MKFWLAGFAGESALNALLGTVRFRVMTPGPPAGKPVIYTLWHGRLLPLTYFHRNQRITTLISRSADGEYIARVVERWGYATARGSSSRGGSSGLREMIQAARHGSSLAITPDGPRGPRQKLKPGVLNAAQLSGLPLLPMSGAASRAWWIEGWDRFLIPKPFSTMFVRYAEPIYIPRDATSADLLVFEREVEQILNDLTEQADADANA
jgi:lysophospholipid acyltransferase (LPLAT)-like uncharacterized protein